MFQGSTILWQWFFRLRCASWMIPFQVVLDDHQGGMNLHRQLNQILKSILRQKREGKKPLLSQIYLRIWPSKHPRAVAVIKNVTEEGGGSLRLWFSFVSYFVEQNYWWNVERSVSKGFLCNGRLGGMCLLQYHEWPLGEIKPHETSGYFRNFKKA